MSLPKQRSMTVAVVAGALVVPDALLAVGFTRDDRLDFLVFKEGAKRIGVIAFAGQEVLDAGDQADHSCAMTQSAVLPGVKINTHGLRSASTIAWILLLRPPFVNPIA